MKTTISFHQAFIARITVEADTPLRIGSGETGLLSDNLVAKGPNGLPYLPGASLAGVLRHSLIQEGVAADTVSQLFGYQEQGSSDTNKGQGSRVILSSGYLLGSDGCTVHEGLGTVPDDPYYTRIQSLPKRDHVRITHWGVAQATGKFEEELVPKGARFVFDLELQGEAKDEIYWEKLLDTVHQDHFRIGAGTRKGFGKLKVISCCVQDLDLRKPENLTIYLKRGSSLNSPLRGVTTYEHTGEQSTQYYHYSVTLQPEHFFTFGSGLGSEQVNSLPKRSFFFDWESGVPILKEKNIVIPATSVKGALSHRIAFHYNHQRPTPVLLERAGAIDTAKLGLNFDLEASIAKLKVEDSITESTTRQELDELRQQIESLELKDLSQWDAFEKQTRIAHNVASKAQQVDHVGEQNEAVRTLFGFANDHAGGARGKVVFSDLYLPDSAVESKVFAHVKIDRFTGGGIPGALFTEEAVTTQSHLTMEILVEKNAFDAPGVQGAFEASLDDLTNGHLMLGGHAGRGHGTFLGKWTVQ